LLDLRLTESDPKPTFSGAESGHCHPGKVDIAPLSASVISDRGGFQWSPPVIGSSALPCFGQCAAAKDRRFLETRHAPTSVSVTTGL
jgi:hypothetical protein